MNQVKLVPVVVEDSVMCSKELKFIAHRAGGYQARNQLEAICACIYAIDEPIIVTDSNDEIVRSTDAYKVLAEKGAIVGMESESIKIGKWTVKAFTTRPRSHLRLVV